MPRHRTTTTDKSGRPQRLDRYAAKANTMPEAKPGAKDPVKLLFGRPDIGVYLTETFAAQTEAHGTPDDSGFLTCGPSLSGASVSSTGIARAARLPGRQVRSRGHMYLLACLGACSYRRAARSRCGEGSGRACGRFTRRASAIYSNEPSKPSSSPTVFRTYVVSPPYAWHSRWGGSPSTCWWGVPR